MSMLFAHISVQGYKCAFKGTVHQMYECVSEVLLHLEMMSGIGFTAQTAQIWPKNEKTCFNKMYPASFEECPCVLLGVPLRPFRGKTQGHSSKDAGALLKGPRGTPQRTQGYILLKHVF